MAFEGIGFQSEVAIEPLSNLVDPARAPGKTRLKLTRNTDGTMKCEYWGPVQDHNGGALTGLTHGKMSLVQMPESQAIAEFSDNYDGAVQAGPQSFVFALNSNPTEPQYFSVTSTVLAAPNEPWCLVGVASDDPNFTPTN